MNVKKNIIIKNNNQTNQNNEVSDIKMQRGEYS